jgi:hypothetical protein
MLSAGSCAGNDDDTSEIQTKEGVEGEQGQGPWGLAVPRCFIFNFSIESICGTSLRS